MAFVLNPTLLQPFEYCRSHRSSALPWSLWKKSENMILKITFYSLAVWDSLEIESGMCVYSRSWWTRGKLWGCHPGWIPISAWWFNSVKGGGLWKIPLFTCQTIKTRLHNGKDPTISTLHCNCWCQWPLQPLRVHAGADLLSSAQLVSPRKTNLAILW